MRGRDGGRLEASRMQPPSPLSHLLPASPVSSAGGSPSVLPTRCPYSDTVPLLPIPPAASPGTSIRRCAGTWKPPQSPAAGGKIPMWISEFPYQNLSPPPLYEVCQYQPLNYHHY